MTESHQGLKGTQHTTCPGGRGLLKDMDATTANRLTQLLVLEDSRSVKFTDSLLLYEEINYTRSSFYRLSKACPPRPYYLCSGVSGNLEMHLEEGIILR